MIGAELCGMCGIVAQCSKRRERGLPAFFDTPPSQYMRGERGERSEKQANGFPPHARVRGTGTFKLLNIYLDLLYFIKYSYSYEHANPNETEIKAGTPSRS